MVDNVSKSMTLLPEYQEKFLKDLLANIYQVDEETGTITGIAAKSPLEGQQYYQTADGGSTLDPSAAAMDEAGNPIRLYESAAGGFTSDPSAAALDQYDQPIFAMEGGVGAPDVIGFTDAQIDALDRLMGATDEDGNVIYEGMMEAYKPYLDEALETYRTGVDTIDASTAEYDPTSYKDYYDPFVEEVIDTTLSDIGRQTDIERNRIGADSISAGAFGGSRQAVAEQELARNSADQMAKTGAQLRSAAFTGAQQQAQSAFENQQKRGLEAGQLFQGLGTGIGALGEAAQTQGFQDFNTLFNAGALEQQQLQKQYDVQRAADLEQAYEPFARFSYMRDILQGVPSSGTSLAAAATPQASPLGATLNYAGQLGGATGGLGTLKNVSGA
jgi:hypothetical protein